MRTSLSAIRRALALALLCSIVASPVVSNASTPLPPHLQLGCVALDPQTEEGWSSSVELPFALDRLRLEGAGPAFELRGIDDFRSRLVFSPRGEGPVSTLLVIDDHGADSAHCLIAGEVIKAPRGDWPTLILSQPDARAPLRYAVRVHEMAAVRSVILEGEARAVSPADAEGWQRLPDLTTRGRSEARGRLVLADGSTPVKVQASALASLTSMARHPLGSGFAWERLLPLRETIGPAGLRARVAVLGRARDGRKVRIFDLVDVRGEPALALTEEFELPAVQARRQARLRAVRVPGRENGVRTRRVVELVGERALLIDPRTGYIGARRAPGLRFTGAAATSPLQRNTVLAVRREARTGDFYLRRWSVTDDGGGPRLSARKFRPALSDLFNAAAERAFDSVISVRPLGWPQQPVRERLYLLGRSEARPRIWGIRFDRRAGRVNSVRERWIGSVRIPTDGPSPRLRILDSPVAGEQGLPTGIRVTLPAVQRVRMLQRSEFGARFSSLRDLPLLASRAATSGLALAPRRFLSLDGDGQGNLLFRRYVSTPNGLFARAGRRIANESPVRMQASARSRHAWTLSRGRDGRMLRIFDLGLGTDVNLPPRVDLGPDLRVRAADVEGTFVSLRSRLRDTNDDRLALRWSAPGIRFNDSSAPDVRGFFPVGTTRVRLRAIDGRAFLAGPVAKIGTPFEASDYVNVTVLAPTAAPAVPGLRTAIAAVFPNPANPKVRIAYSIAHGGPVTLDVVDVRGRHVRTLVREHRNAGAWDTVWDGSDDAGRSVASGVYLVHLKADGQLDVARVSLVR